jgi:hypothetical protein
VSEQFIALRDSCRFGLLSGIEDPDMDILSAMSDAGLPSPAWELLHPADTGSAVALRALTVLVVLVSSG